MVDDIGMVSGNCGGDPQLADHCLVVLRPNPFGDGGNELNSNTTALIEPEVYGERWPM
jgi:hypothetical protein